MKEGQESIKTLCGYIDEMASKSVLVIGDIMLDRFVYGSVNRMSPEAPVPVLHVERQEDVLGGAGNVLSNLAGLNVRSFVLGIVGQDTVAGELKTLVQECGVNPSGLLIDPERPTIVKNRFLDKNQHLLRVDSECVEDISSALENELFEKARQLIGDVQAMVLSDYGKGVLSRSLTLRLIALANENNVPVLVDPKGDDYTKYEGASVATPNSKELSEATDGLKTGTDDEVIEAAQILLKASGIKSVVATRSQEGMTVFEKEGPPVHVRATAQEVFDVTGAGDTVIATLASSLAAGASLVQAAILSNLAGGLVVAKLGTTAVCSSDLKRAAEQCDIGDTLQEVA